MASCLSSFCVSIKPSIRHKYNTRQGVQVRAQSFSDEGNSLICQSFSFWTLLKSDLKS